MTGSPHPPSTAPESQTPEERTHCGHPASAIESSDEGTSYCRDCATAEVVAQIRTRLAAHPSGWKASLEVQVSWWETAAECLLGLLDARTPPPQPPVSPENSHSGARGDEEAQDEEGGRCRDCGETLADFPPATPAKLLFLDLDGVMNRHERFPNKFCGLRQENIAHLNTILAAVPDLQIVLSSAWRYAFGNAWVVQHLLCCHGVDCFERIHGVTAHDPVPEDHPPYDDKAWWDRMGLEWRGAQIEEYVTAHKPARFAVLDDLPIPVEHLFKTESEIGLTDEIARAVIAHFGVLSGPSGADGGEERA